MLGKIKKWFVILFIILIISFLVFLLVASVSDFKPAKTSDINIHCGQTTRVINSTELSFISWNIGYGGLGKKMDFFYDGGKKVRPEKTEFNYYWKNIKKVIESLDTADFILLQEVDFESKRSYFVKQDVQISSILNDFCMQKVLNYSVRYVPVPLFKPMGVVHGGLLTFSKYTPDQAFRHSYPELASWPEKLFLLDRCFIESRYKINSQKELVILNTHNSYYIKDDSLREMEIQVIRQKMLDEYAKGNYVIAGGDWNQNPPGLKNVNFKSNDLFKATHLSMRPEFPAENWKFVFDKQYPTNRWVDTPYHPGETPTTIIDFFIVSPNVHLIDVKTIPLDFEYSDHQPVFMKIRLSEK